MHRRALLLSSSLLPLAAQRVTPPDDVRRAVNAVIKPLMAQHGIPGLAAGLTVDGREYLFTYGVASRASQAPVTASTLFEVGSVSKVFTATLATYAAAAGKLSLAHHPSRYLPGLKGSAIDRATLLHFGTYTPGGLPLQFPAEVTTDQQAMSYFRQWKPASPPGAYRQYSNPSLGLFGAATAAALGEPFAQALEVKILRPLGLERSFIHVPAEAMPDYAWGDRDGQALRVQPGPLDQPTYGLKTTAADLLRLVRANIDASHLQSPLRPAIEGTQRGYFRVGPMVQALGWEQYDYPASREWLLGGNSAEMIFGAQPAYRLEAQAATPAPTRASWFNKTGSTNGFGAYVAFVPRERLGLVMLANRNYPIPARVEAAFAILQQLKPARRN